MISRAPLAIAAIVCLALAQPATGQRFSRKDADTFKTKLARIVENYAGTNAAAEGRLLLAQVRLRQGQPQQAEKAERQYINVPYKEKDEAKQLGARWDRQQQSWYVPAGVDAAPFAKWAQGAAMAAVVPRAGQEATQAQGAGQKPAQARQYLAVPYEQRREAKAAGALWDKAAIVTGHYILRHDLPARIDNQHPPWMHEDYPDSVLRGSRAHHRIVQIAVAAIRRHQDNLRALDCQQS